jgi:hypothetical protein
MSAHKFTVGQTVRLAPDRYKLQSATHGAFEVVRPMPEAAGVFQYRVKSRLDGHERVAREDELSRP